MSASDEPVVQGRFGRYDVERLLARGGMGAVFLARQVDLHRQVALKVIAGEHQDGSELERFRLEALATARIDSDNVVKVYEAGRIGSLPFIAMEYVDGRSAAEVLALYGKLEPPLAAAIVLAAARGLKAAHDAGIVHRDVKPANLLVCRDGRVKLTDFGVAKLIGPELRHLNRGVITKEGALVGTPFYVAPEQVMGDELDGRADVFALGVTFYELLTGAVPWDGGSRAETVALRFRGAAPSPRARVPSLPASYDEACVALIECDAKKRPTSAEALAILERLGASVATAALGGLFVAVDARTATVAEVPAAEPAPARSPASTTAGATLGATVDGLAGVGRAGGLFVALDVTPAPAPDTLTLTPSRASGLPPVRSAWRKWVVAAGLTSPALAFLGWAVVRPEARTAPQTRDRTAPAPRDRTAPPPVASRWSESASRRIKAAVAHGDAVAALADVAAAGSDCPAADRAEIARLGSLRVQADFARLRAVRDAEESIAPYRALIALWKALRRIAPGVEPPEDLAVFTNQNIPIYLATLIHERIAIAVDLLDLSKDLGCLERLFVEESARSLIEHNFYDLPLGDGRSLARRIAAIAPGSPWAQLALVRTLVAADGSAPRELAEGAAVLASLVGRLPDSSEPRFTDYLAQRLVQHWVWGLEAGELKEHAERLVERAPSCFTHQLLSGVLVELGERERAERERAAILDAPEPEHGDAASCFVAASMALGAGYESTGDLEAAARCLDRASSRAGAGQGRFWVLRARIALADQDRRSARRCLEAARDNAAKPDRAAYEELARVAVAATDDKDWREVVRRLASDEYGPYRTRFVRR